MGIMLTTMGTIFCLIAVAYLGWALFLIGGLIGTNGGLIGETGRTVGDWYFIRQVALHGLVFLGLGAVGLFFGIKRLTSNIRELRDIGVRK